MSETIWFGLDQASEQEIAWHLSDCDADFLPALSDRVEIKDYAKKIATHATKFEAWSGSRLVGLIAAYCNDREKRIAYITSVSVMRDYAGLGVATTMMAKCVEHMMSLGMRQISLEVSSENMPAIKLYEKSGFILDKAKPPFITMDLHLKSGEENE